MSKSSKHMKQRLTPEEIQLYRVHFETFDLNKDGVISARELKKVSHDLGYRLTDIQIEAIMHGNDLDENGFLSFDEFLLAMPANTDHISGDEHELAKIRHKFQEFDKDGNGVVNMEEAHEILRTELGFTPQQTIELVRRYDRNNDGHLSYEEFVTFYQKVKAKAQRIRDMFKQFDKDNSGAISVSEAKLMLHQLDIPDQEIETLVAMYDTNKDGELQYEEFAKFVSHA